MLHSMPNEIILRFQFTEHFKKMLGFRCVSKFFPNLGKFQVKQKNIYLWSSTCDISFLLFPSFFKYLLTFPHRFSIYTLCWFNIRFLLVKWGQVTEIQMKVSVYLENTYIMGSSYTSVKLLHTASCHCFILIKASTENDKFILLESHILCGAS